MVALYHTNRSIFKFQGPDVVSFLQGIMTNDMKTLPENKILYTAMLTPRGRFHFEFFVYEDPQNPQVIYIETPTLFATDFLKRLRIFKLRSDVEIEELANNAHVVTYHDEIPPEGSSALQDPRCEAMGYRGLVFGDLLEGFQEDEGFYNQLCLENCVPRAGIELIPEKTIPLEANFEALNALSFTKGCYLGQELTARTKHQGLVRKQLYTVAVEGDLLPEDFKEGIVIYAGDLKIGELLSGEQGLGIAKLRIEEREAHKDVTWQGILKGSKKECCKITYLPRK